MLGVASLEWQLSVFALFARVLRQYLLKSVHHSDLLFVGAPAVACCLAGYFHAVLHQEVESRGPKPVGCFPLTCWLFELVVELLLNDCASILPNVDRVVNHGALVVEPEHAVVRL